MARKHKFIKLTIAEPFPVICRDPHHRGAGDPAPFYAANSEWYTLYSKRAMQHQEFTANYWRERGYTVSLEKEVR